ncbi:hypothetical protein B0H13DRAFT_2656430 [Mycena leptocephala]|nr:hypothetical protein B0H13DRAFT_2656430 [Mycena leptocephala]
MHGGLRHAPPPACGGRSSSLTLPSSAEHVPGRLASPCWQTDPAPPVAHRWCRARDLLICLNLLSTTARPARAASPRRLHPAPRRLGESGSRRARCAREPGLSAPESQRLRPFLRKHTGRQCVHAKPRGILQKCCAYLLIPYLFVSLSPLYRSLLYYACS